MGLTSTGPPAPSGSASVQRNVNRAKRDICGRDRDRLRLSRIGHGHVPRYRTGNLQRDPISRRRAAGVTLGIVGALLPMTRDPAAAVIQLAPDLDLVVVAGTTNGHAELRPAACIIGIAFDALAGAVGEAVLAGTTPGAKQRVERPGVRERRLGRGESEERKRQD